MGFISLKESRQADDKLAEELKEWIGKKIGRFAMPEKIIFAADLPKTRSGKIMRRLLRDIASGRALGNVTTLADAGVVEQLKRNTKRIKGYQKGVCMMRRNLRFIVLGILLLSTSGCALLGIAASAAASYGIYQATRK